MTKSPHRFPQYKEVTVEYRSTRRNTTKSPHRFPQYKGATVEYKSTRRNLSGRNEVLRDIDNQTRWKEDELGFKENGIYRVHSRWGN